MATPRASSFSTGSAATEPTRRRYARGTDASRHPTTDHSSVHSGDNACAATSAHRSPAMLCIVTFVLLTCFFLYAAIQGKDTAIGLALVPLFCMRWHPGSRGWRVPQPAFKLLPIMYLGLLLRYLAAYFRLENAADALYYHRYGKLIAPEFRALSFGVDVRGEVPGTGTVRYISGLITVFTGNSIFAEFLVFTTFAFIGVVFFYKAFVARAAERRSSPLRVADLPLAVSGLLAVERRQGSHPDVQHRPGCVRRGARSSDTN